MASTPKPARRVLKNADNSRVAHAKMAGVDKAVQGARVQKSTAHGSVSYIPQKANDLRKSSVKKANQAWNKDYNSSQERRTMASKFGEKIGSKLTSRKTLAKVEAKAGKTANKALGKGGPSFKKK